MKTYGHVRLAHTHNRSYFIIWLFIKPKCDLFGDDARHIAVVEAVRLDACVVAQVGLAVDDRTDAQARAEEIGRASCRERVSLAV